MPGRALLLATTNPAKLERLRWVFSDLGFELRALPPPAGAGPEEDGASFAENAALKARYWSRGFDGLVAASDGGLAIPALGPRWNALRTARMAGPQADDATRARHLLALAADLKGDERAVYWTEALALARDDRLLASWSVDGSRAMLIEQFEPADLEPGFWADSLCYVPDHGMSLARLYRTEPDLAGATWAGLRERVRGYFTSGKADA